MQSFKEWPNEQVDLLVAGTPCQSFSVAGLRAGLSDPRGNLTLTYLGVANKYKPEWLVWENVPGILSSNRGRDFGAFLGALGKLGYGYAYRVLDTKYIRTPRFPGAIPQTRRRLFVVARFGDAIGPASVLFDEESLRRNSTSRRDEGGDDPSFTKSGFASWREGVGTIRASGGDCGGGSETLYVEEGLPRKLTPRECERLQGFPDDFTLIPTQKRVRFVKEPDFLNYRLRSSTGGMRYSESEAECMAADGPRYTAIGNSMSVNAMCGIGRAIDSLRPIISDMGGDGA